MPRFSNATEDRRNRCGVAVIAVVLFGLAAGLLAFVGMALHRGSFDARSRYAPEPAYLHAAEEPFWFYGLLVVALVLAGYLLYLGGRMARHTRRPTGRVLRRGRGAALRSTRRPGHSHRDVRS